MYYYLPSEIKLGMPFIMPFVAKLMIRYKYDSTVRLAGVGRDVRVVVQ